MAPEQLSSPHCVTPSSDVYALGVSWYEMLTNEKLHPQAVGAKAFRPATEDRDIAAVINRMLLYRPEERPTIVEITGILDAFSKRANEQRTLAPA